MFKMKRLVGNLEKSKRQFEKNKYTKTKNDHEDIDSYTRKLLDKNMKELDKHRGV